MLLILISSITNRLRYIANILINEMLGVEVQFTLLPDEYIKYSGPKLTYSNKPMDDGLFIEASDLLFEEMIAPREIKTSEIDGVPVIFTSVHPASVLPFDPFAAAFYMVSRYEEYLPHIKDKYGRFPVTESIAWKRTFLNIPVVHLWAEMVRNLLVNKYPGLLFKYPEYRYVPTIDVDHAFCYRGRTLTRTLGGLGKDALQGRFNDIILRIRVLTGLTLDSYDNYSFITKVHEPYKNFPLYFILFADYGGDDNNVTVTSKSFHFLLNELDRHHGVGIHPSLYSNKKFKKLQKEYASLCLVINRDVTISRQHFLHLTLPETYRRLIQLGISDDYSMGYASHPGFRAGIAIPFQFFDLKINETTSLMIHPVSIMDVTMKDYLRLSTEESLDTIKRMINTIKSVNGEFVSLWHNESLGETGPWKGWRGVYEEMVKIAST